MEESPRSQKRTRVDFAGVTDVGRQRKHNEDCLLIKPEHGLYCVADGMGGHNAGDVASKLVTTSLSNYFEATAQGAAPLELPRDYAALPPGARRLVAGVSKANRDVFTISNTHQQHHGMGSTCVAVHLCDGAIHIAHVGDSRCYRIRDGVIQQMTRDHSLINDALELKPDLTREELARLPKNIITRALGMKELVKVDIKSEPVLPGDIYLLCSDGLTGMVPVDQILDLINVTQDAQEACELLVSEANEHGGTDNISALLVRIDPAPYESQGEIDISAHAELEHADDDPEPVLESDLEDESENENEPVLEGELESESDPEPVLESEIESDEHESELEPAYEMSPAPVSTPVVRARILEIVDSPASPPVEAVTMGGAPPARPVMTAAPPEAPAPPPAPPHVAVEERLGGVDGLVSPEAAEALAAGGEIDLDLQGPWAAQATVQRCPRCRFELFPGNRFCVECGALVGAAFA